MKAKGKLLSFTAATAFGAAVVYGGPASVTGAGAPHTLPSNSHAFNSTPAELVGTFLREMLLGEGNTDYVGPFKRVNAQSYEAIGGSGTLADPSIEVGYGQHTVKPGTPLCRFPWLMWREAYQDGSVDIQFPDPVFLNGIVAEIEVTLDGKVIVSNENKIHFYLPETPFDPLVVYPEPSSSGAVNAFSYQCMFFLVPPLPPGTHTLKTHLRIEFSPDMGSIFPPEGQGLISDDTVTIVVTPN